MVPSSVRLEILPQRTLNHSEFLVEDGLDRVGIRLGLSEVVLDSELSVIPGRVGLGNDLEELGADIQSFLGVIAIVVVGEELGLKSAKLLGFG